MTPPALGNLALRPARLDDADDLVALVNANSMALTGEAETTLKEVTDELNDPDLDVERDTRVVFAPDGRLIAYSAVWGAGRPALPFVDVFLHTSEWGRDTTTTPRLLEWAEARTRENLPQIAPELRVAIRGYSHPNEDQHIAALLAAGYQPIRHSFEMAIDFDAPPEAPPPSRWFHAAHRRTRR